MAGRGKKVGTPRPEVYVPGSRAKEKARQKAALASEKAISNGICQKAAAQARKVGDHTQAAAFLIGEFEEEFCRQYARSNLLAESFIAAEIRTNSVLDLSGYKVQTSQEKQGDVIRRVRRIILASDGSQVLERDVRYAKASQLLSYPEIKDRIAQIKQEAAAAVKVTGESISEELDSIFAQAMSVGQLEAALKTRQVKATLFGLTAGMAGGGSAGGSESDKDPVTSVEVVVVDGKKDG